MRSFRLHIAALLAVLASANCLVASEDSEDLGTSQVLPEDSSIPDEFAPPPRRAPVPTVLASDAEGPVYYDDSIRWYFQAEALILQRTQHSGHGNQPVVLEELTDAVLLRSQDATIASSAGPRLLLGRYLDDSSAVELIYWGISPWVGSASVSGDNDLNIPGDLGLATLDFRDADTISIRQESELHNVEVNYVLDREGISLLAGFRYLRYRDQFNIHSIDTSGPDTGASDYATSATNNLYGAQLGALLDRQWGMFGWDFSGKAGIYGNDMTQSNLVRDFDNTFTFRDTGGNDSAVAFIGEINVSGSLQITRRVALRAGYNVVWIEGLGLAGDQLDFTLTPNSGSAATTSGGVFLHGVNVGLHASW